MLKKLKNLSKQNKKRLILISIAIILAIILLSVGAINKIVANINKKNAEELKEITYQIYKVNGSYATTLITFNNENGIEKITYKNYEKQEKTIYCYGKTKVAIDYEMEDLNSYNFNVIYINGEEKNFTIDFEIPKIQGLYTLKNGIYVNEPDVRTGFIADKTRYLYLNEDGNLVPGNWLTGNEPEQWYDYSNQNWANIYVENEGIESYYVWIPRYCYKVDTDNSITGNERMDVKFINIYNEYIDASTGEKTTWTELESQGYQIPEAFSWGAQFNEHTLGTDIDTIIPGYWISKYQLSELEKFNINYSMAASKDSIYVSNFTNNVSSTATKFTYAINGNIVNTSSTLEEYTFTNLNESEKYVVNVTALNSNDEIVGSMTKTLETVEVNLPELSAFDPDTTFYVYWDEDGNEYNEIPISQEPPSNWYNYTFSQWANIVSRNDGLETYYVWIPRYQYKLNQTSQRSDIKFILDTNNVADEGYQIPEAFWWDNDGDGVQDEGEQLTGYWMTKYQLTSEESTPRMNAEMSAGSNLIRIKDITGTLITTAETNGTNIKYEYYLNGTKVHEGTSSTENYVYQGLNQNTTYTINIIARNSDTNEYIGAVTKKITTIAPYAPDISSFDKDTTYYVVYDNDGNETRVSIKEKAPSNWYDYSNQIWANIVTTANDTETYFVWIPRYEYKILEDRDNLSTDNRRIDVNFITTDITNSNCTAGYKVPEAFWWDNNGNEVQDEGEQLTGYWISKYQLND